MCLQAERMEYWARFAAGRRRGLVAEDRSCSAPQMAGARDRSWRAEGKNIPSPAAVRQTEARPLDGSGNPFGAALREAARPSRVLLEISHCVFRNERSGLWLCRPRSFGLRRVYLSLTSMAGFQAAERCEADRNKIFKGRGNQYAAAHLCSRILKGAKSKGVGWQPGALWLLVDIA